MLRINLLKNHLSSSSDTSSFVHENPASILQNYRSKSTVNPNVIKQLFMKDHQIISERVIEVLSKDSIFQREPERERQEQKTVCFLQMKRFFELYGPITYESFKKNPAIPMEIGNSVVHFDTSLAARIMVQFVLYAQTLVVLGTEKHKKLIEDAFSLRDIGCFALTELGHGTNANGILTTATYDRKANEFVIDTPQDTALKMWIGGAGQSSTTSVVFAQLFFNNKNYGVHAFIVPLRNKLDHTLLPGVIAGDCGLKLGWNGVDTGFIRFRNVRVPYDNMLDKFCSINKEGKYLSPIKDAGKRFALTISALSGGRVFVLRNSINLMSDSLTIAFRYAAIRRQFGPSNKLEASVLEYPLTQYRLLPYLAKVLGLKAAAEAIKERWFSLQNKLFKHGNHALIEFHAILSCLKPFCSWTAQYAIQECREVCGGLGYSSYNRIGEHRNDNDAILSEEGDNNVLLQQSGKFLLECFRLVKIGKQQPFSSAYFMNKDAPSYLVNSGQSESQFLRDQYSIKKALETRANCLIHTFGEQFRKVLREIDSFLDTWNNVQAYYCHEAVKSYCDLFVANEYWRVIQECKDANTKGVLEKLYELYGYHMIEKGAATLLKVGYMTRNDLVYIRDKIITLCGELKDQAIGIIDVIGAPDKILKSPIGASDGNAYSRFIGVMWTGKEVFERPDYWKDVQGIKSLNENK